MESSADIGSLSRAEHKIVVDPSHPSNGLLFHAFWGQIYMFGIEFPGREQLLC